MTPPYTAFKTISTISSDGVINQRMLHDNT